MNIKKIKLLYAERSCWEKKLVSILSNVLLSLDDGRYGIPLFRRYTIFW